MIICYECGNEFEKFAEQLNMFDSTVVKCCPMCATEWKEGGIKNDE